MKRLIILLLLVSSFAYSNTITSERNIQYSAISINLEVSSQPQDTLKDCMAKITVGQKNSLLNKHFVTDMYFNPVQDINGDWFISIEEMEQCINPPFIWVKTLELSDFVKPDPPVIE